MKFEVKTQNDDISKSYINIFLVLVVLSLLFVLFNISIKLGTISRHYEINYLCKLIKIDKKSSNFKKLSNLTNENTKQKIWDLCKEIVN